MNLWGTIEGFLVSIYERFNGFLQGALDIDGRLIGLYEEFVVPLPELFKIVGVVFTGIVIVLGVLSFVKKIKGISLYNAPKMTKEMKPRETI